MSVPKIPPPVKLIFSVIYADSSNCQKGISMLQKEWGAIDFLKMDLPFHHTTYYEREMGHPLRRCFLSFKTLIDRQALVTVKRVSNQIENDLAKEDGRRTLNLDPGYVTDYQLVLASGKNFSHRIYLGEGVFADLTLVFREKKFEPLPWTYPDYRQAPLMDALMAVRADYLKDRSNV